MPLTIDAMATTGEQRQARFSFTGKVVIVTGAARGLGRVTALGFAHAGAKVVISDIDDAGGEETLRLLRSDGGEGLYVHTDVRDEAQVQGMIQKTVNSTVLSTMRAPKWSATSWIRRPSIVPCCSIRT